ncbi:MAG: hypothetical protein P1V20_10355 [Verrucomicrobiales bacterium]|nr:hypothetical protein [Verrucomicrobiales bacterium]
MAQIDANKRVRDTNFTKMVVHLPDRSLFNRGQIEVAELPKLRLVRVAFAVSDRPD